MIKILILYPILFLSMIFGAPWESDARVGLTLDESTQSTDVMPLDPVLEMIDLVNQDRILSDLRRLTGEEPICTTNGCTTISGRETGTQNLQTAQDYVYETLINLHYTVEVLDWTRGGYSDENIVARKQGLIYPSEEIYLIAHMDGVIDNNPAADDDASGVVSLLEVARILPRYSLKRSVVLFFSSGEEHGSLGSRSYVEQFPERLGSILYLVSVEMLGYDSNNDGAMEFWNGTQPLDFVQLLSDIIQAYPIDLVPEIVSGCTWGDEGPFRENGVTAAVQIQDYHGDLDPNNHLITDVYENINQAYLYEQVKGTIAITGQLTEPIIFKHRIRLPFIWMFKY